MSKHTPGPWLIELPSLDVISDDENLSICSVQPVDTGGPKMFHHGGVTRANARLIAAAPDLLEALEELVKINDEHNLAVEAICGRPLGWKDSYLDVARAAIARATGEQP